MNRVIDASVHRLGFAVVAHRPKWNCDSLPVHGDDRDKRRGWERRQRSKIPKLFPSGEGPQLQVDHGVTGGVNAVARAHGVHRLSAASCHGDRYCWEARMRILRVDAVTENQGRVSASDVVGAGDRWAARCPPVYRDGEIRGVTRGVQPNHALVLRLPNRRPDAVRHLHDARRATASAHEQPKDSSNQCATPDPHPVRVCHSPAFRQGRYRTGSGTYRRLRGSVAVVPIFVVAGGFVWGCQVLRDPVRLVMLLLGSTLLGGAFAGAVNLIVHPSSQNGGPVTAGLLAGFGLGLVAASLRGDG